MRAIVADLARVSREVTERRHRLSVLSNRRGPEVRGPVRGRIGARSRRNWIKTSIGSRSSWRELRQLGVEPKSASEGLVDFPAIIDGRMVYLCWKLGEPEVQFWHEITAGFQGRQPLGAAGPQPRQLSDTTTGL